MNIPVKPSPSRASQTDFWLHRHQSIWWLFARPWTLLRYPAVLWAALTHGVLLGWVAVQLTADGGFFPALYQFNALQTGNINISVRHTSRDLVVS